MSTDPRKGKPSSSSLQRIASCPASYLLEAMAGTEYQLDSKYADAGTALHKHMELGTLPENAEDAAACEQCSAWEQELVAKLFPDTYPSIAREVRYWDVDGRFSGEMDKVYYTDSKALIIDYKFGRKKVPALHRNLQLLSYATLWEQHHPLVQEVYVATLQPFVGGDPDLLRYSEGDLLRGASYIRSVLDRAEQPGQPCNPTADNCRYCKAQATCPALAALRQSVTMDKQELAFSWASLSMEQRVELYRRAQAAKKSIETIERFIKQDLEAQLPLPGLSFKKGASRRVVSDVPLAHHICLELGITQEQFTEASTLSISKLETFYTSNERKNNPALRVKDCKERFSEAISKAVSNSASAASIFDEGA